MSLDALKVNIILVYIINISLLLNYCTVMTVEFGQSCGLYVLCYMLCPFICLGCKTSEFRCGDGTCIPDYNRCDRTYDCTDGSDELDGCEGKICLIKYTFFSFSRFLYRFSSIWDIQLVRSILYYFNVFVYYC